VAPRFRALHYSISLDFVRKFFEDRAHVIQSIAVARSVRERKVGEQYKGNRRMDFLIKF